MTVLSWRAMKLYERIQSGRFYRLYDPNTPAAMQELIDAGLVKTAARPMVIVAAYVPATGYQPFQMERFGTDEDTP